MTILLEEFLPCHVLLSQIDKNHSLDFFQLCHLSKQPGAYSNQTLAWERKLRMSHIGVPFKVPLGDGVPWFHGCSMPATICQVTSMKCAKNATGMVWKLRELVVGNQLYQLYQLYHTTIQYNYMTATIAMY